VIELQLSHLASVAPGSTPQRSPHSGPFRGWATGLEAWGILSALNAQSPAEAWHFESSSQTWQAHLPSAPGSDPGFPEFLAPGDAVYLKAVAPADLSPPDPTLRIRHYHGDHLGSSSVITDANGGLVEESAFHPFGRPRNEYEPRQIREPYQFTRKELDRESGLHYFEARYLDAARARFISVDAAYAAPDKLPPEKLQAMLRRPQLLNLYSYALDAPVKYQDPTGLEVVKLDWRQTIQVIAAQQQALAMLDYSIKSVERNLNSPAPGNPTDPLLERWFGKTSGLGNIKQIRANLHKIRDQLAGLLPENFVFDNDPQGDVKNAIAYVYANDSKKVYLTAKFFRLQDMGVDSKPGTLIHENSHPTSVIGTDDLVYGPGGAANLTARDNGQTLKNADNYEYFNESAHVDRVVRDATRQFNEILGGCSPR